ncbi:hyoscyamine 6-dioxygenase-like [Gossypium australe]|uniref:Hyoscyamine 6-dioxygenase-like n=1 Tax=Gossypium australe TaxID=47621 RepID=A0A5B6VI79_9ROSI|nr:hyoscyamine 6-dioxygenase-like [Gossypium australe]
MALDHLHSFHSLSLLNAKLLFNDYGKDTLLCTLIVLGNIKDLKNLNIQVMEKLVSSWFNNKTLPQSYIFPPETRPGNHVIPRCNTIPVINHGVSENLVNDTMNVFKEFFELPAEDKAGIYSEDLKRPCRLYTRSPNFNSEKVHLWRDNLRHPCHPLEDCVKIWPQKPTRYRALAHERTAVVQQILEASQEFGFFQVINHGVSENLVNDTMNVFKEFLELPAEDKAGIYSEDLKRPCRLYTSSPNFNREKVHLWRDNLRHPCHPLEDCVKIWPQKPTRYRDIVATYSIEAKKLGLRILELLSEGLGLGSGFFGDKLSESVVLSVNHYPPCPDPSLTLGVSRHCDPDLLTILHQGDVYGLQVFKDGEWIGVEPLNNAFVVNIGHQLEKLVSSWFNNKTLPQSYIFPPETRPGNHIIPRSNTIPVIDLGNASAHDRTLVVQQILKASQEFGFFQVINHGISEVLMNDSMNLFKEFFELPAEDKADLYSEEFNRPCKLYTSSANYDGDKVHLWRDSLRHPCHPLEECIKIWPQKPTRYREIVAAYSIEAKKLGSRILDLISEGLGLDLGYFGDKLSESVVISVNHYPPCPDPSLTLGIAKHCDPSLLTILLQGDVFGLQVLNDGKWIGVEPLHNAFVVNIGHQLEVVSNNRLKGAEHRVVTNSTVARTTAAIFLNPSEDCIVEPAKSIIGADESPVYRAFKFKEFLCNYVTMGGNSENSLEPFKLHG